MAKLSDKIKQSSVSDRIRVAILAELENISTATGTTGLATEATALNILNAIVASGQDVEVLLVRDTGDSDKVLQQVTDYINNTTVYKDVNGNIVVPVGPLEYLDPSAVLNLILSQNTAINNKIITDDDDNAITDGQTLPLSISELYGHWDGAWQRITTDGSNRLVVAADSLPLPTGAATETTALQIDSSIVLGNLTLNSLNTKFASVTRTPALLVVSGVANTTVAAGARSVTFFNQGPTAATVAGGVLDAGESMTFSAGGEDDVLAAIPYITIATGVLKIATVV
jgi:hypothetical protein